MVELVTIDKRRQSNSWMMEPEACALALESLAKRGFRPAEVVHDDNQKVDTKLRELNIPMNSKCTYHKKVNIGKGVLAAISDLPEMHYPTLKRHAAGIAARLKSGFYGASKECRWDSTDFRKRLQDAVEQVITAFKLNESEAAFLRTYWDNLWTERQVQFYTRFRKQAYQESLHRLMLKHAPKTKFFQQTMCLRLAFAALEWNENQERGVVRVRLRAESDYKSKGKYKIDYTPKLNKWREELWMRLWSRG